MRPKLRDSDEIELDRALMIAREAMIENVKNISKGGQASVTIVAQVREGIMISTEVQECRKSQALPRPWPRDY